MSTFLKSSPQITLLSNEISTTLREGFKIQDAGALTRGWGD